MIYKIKPVFNAVVFDNNRPVSEDNAPIVKFGTTCCAMGILSAKDYHSYAELSNAIKAIKQDSTTRWFTPDNRDGGERTLLCVASPGEHNLEKNLKKLKFQLMSNKLNRRVGYPAGQLKLYMYSF